MDDLDISFDLDADGAAELGSDGAVALTSDDAAGDIDEVDFALDFDADDAPFDHDAPVTDTSSGVTEGDDLDFALDLDETGTLGVPALDVDGSSANDSTGELDFALDLDETGELGTSSDGDVDFVLDLDPTADVSPELTSEDAESTQYMLRDVPEIGSPPIDVEGVADVGDTVYIVDELAGMTPDSVLDLSVDSPASSIVEAAMDADDSLDFNLETPDGADVDSDSTGPLDINADSTQYMLQEPSESSMNDQSGDVDFALDLDLDAYTGTDLGTDADAPEIDFDFELPDWAAETVADFGTVQLNADDLVRAGAIEKSDTPTATLGDTTDSIEVDGEFADIFAGDAVGLDLDTDLPDSAAAEDDGALDFDLGAGEPEEGGAFQDMQYMLRDIAAITSDTELPDDEEDRTLALGRGPSDDVNEMQTKLDLAQAYIDMGDTEGARGFLGAVMAEGSDDQLTKARDLLNQLN